MGVHPQRSSVLMRQFGYNLRLGSSNASRLSARAPLLSALIPLISPALISTERARFANISVVKQTIKADSHNIKEFFTIEAT